MNDPKLPSNRDRLTPEQRELMLRNQPTYEEELESYRRLMNSDGSEKESIDEFLTELREKLANAQ